MDTVLIFLFLAQLGRFAHFTLRAALAWPRALLQPVEVTRQLYQVLIGALPLGTAAGLALGVVVWLHMHQVLNQFRAAQYLPDPTSVQVMVGASGAISAVLGAYAVPSRA